MFDSELNVTKVSDLNKINENNYNIVVIRNYCNPFLIYDDLSYSYLWINDRNNSINLENKKLNSFIYETALVFENIVKQNFLIELEKITKNELCKLFHEDNNVLRLIITLCGGGGTQYTCNSNINYEHLYKPWNCPDEHNSKLLKDNNLIKTCDVGDLIIMKGKKNKQKSVFHRSFPLESDIDYRYVLKMTVK